MLPVIISDDALEDMADIRRYVSQFSPRAADRIIQALFRVYTTLAKYPYIGHSRQDLTSRPLLFWTEEHKMIVYQATKDRLEIVRVLDSYRNIKKLL